MKIPNPKTICDAVQKFSSKVRVRRDGLSKGINCLLKASNISSLYSSENLKKIILSKCLQFGKLALCNTAALYFDIPTGKSPHLNSKSIKLTLMTHQKRCTDMNTHE